MGIYGKAKSKDFTPAPQGLHRSVCCDVVNLGMVDGQFGRKHMISVVFQTEERMPTGAPYIASKRYTLSMHKKANLRRDIESWRGKAFASDEEAEALDLEKLLGANAQINISHNISDGTTYANIQAIVPAPRGLPPLKVEDYTRKCLRPEWKEPEVDGGSEEVDYGQPDSFEAEEDPVPF